MAEYWRCGGDVIEIADQIIAAHHPHLAGCEILFLFRDQAAKSAGKLIAGKASKMSPKENAIAGDVSYAFKIELASDLWTLNTEAWRRALVDHELCHCAGNEDDGWEIAPHDLEEFASIVERHGLWKSDVRDFVKACDQLDLFHDSMRDFAETMQETANMIGGSVSIGDGNEEWARWDKEGE